MPNYTNTLGELDSRQRAFVRLVWQQGEELYRELPWRGLSNPYAVLVSEVMLQQTQVARVLNYWQRWMELFPTLDALAAAETPLVLERWQGLGYNRRALALKRCAERCAQDYAGQLPKTYDALIALPGIGPATAGGVLAFAYNEPCVYLETNVRAVFLHHFFEGQNEVPDKEIVPLVQATCSVENPRGWYYALLDYGAHLKATVPNPSRRSKHHTQQSRFEGSRRQKRAWVVRYMLAEPEASFEQVEAALNEFELSEGREEVAAEELQSIISDLHQEGFF